MFASGTLTDEHIYIPEAEQLSGGKRWIFKRRVRTEFAVTPTKGIPLDEVKRLLGISAWPQQGFEIKEEQFKQLENALVRLQEKVNATHEPAQGQPKTIEKQFFNKTPGTVKESGQTIDTAELAARKEKSHNSHKLLLNKLAAFLKAKGFRITDNSQVDLFGRRGKEEWIFEVKSTHDGNMLSQVRHGVSQLYEYRYLYRKGSPEVNLGLVLQSAPDGKLWWIAEYLHQDRNILVCWPVPEGFGTAEGKVLDFPTALPTGRYK